MLPGEIEIKYVLIILPVLIFAAIAALFVLGHMSKSGEARGLVESRLSKCPAKPNCVCSEFNSDFDHYIDPINISQGRIDEVLSKLKKSIAEMGGSIQVEKDNYLAATFTSLFFGFVDDLEIRVDSGQKTIHLRSASRVGRGDGGVNRKRVELLKKLFL